MNYSKRLVELMIDEDMINNILDDADPNFYFNFVSITLTLTDTFSKIKSDFKLRYMH